MYLQIFLKLQNIMFNLNKTNKKTFYLKGLLFVCFRHLKHKEVPISRMRSVVLPHTCTMEPKADDKVPLDASQVIFS